LEYERRQIFRRKINNLKCRILQRQNRNVSYRRVAWKDLKTSIYIQTALAKGTLALGDGPQ